MTASEMAEELRHWQKIGGPRAGQISSGEWKSIAEAGAEAIERVGVLAEKNKALSFALNKMIERVSDYPAWGLLKSDLEAIRQEVTTALAPSDARGEKGGAENG